MVVKNRKPRFEQKGVPALSQWFEEQVKVIGLLEAEKLRSRLKADYSVRRYNAANRILPGVVYLYKGKQYVLGGQQNNGYYYYPYGDRNNRMPAKDCTVIQGGGLVFV